MVRKMVDRIDPIEQEAARVLDFLVSTPFEDCYPLSRDLVTRLTRQPCIYAVRHRARGILYIGKSKYTKERFKDGHKAFFWAWLERYDPDDVRLCIAVLSYQQWLHLLSELETIILQASRPPYNVQIPMRD